MGDRCQRVVADVVGQELLQIERQVVVQLELADLPQEIAEAGFLVVPLGRHAERRIAVDRNAPGDRRTLAEFAAQIDEQLVGQAAGPQAIHERPGAADGPAHEQ